MRYKFNECARIRDNLKEVTGQPVDCLVDDLNKAISQLSRDEKNLIKYKFVKGYDLEFISALCETDVNTTAVKLDESMKKLLDNLIKAGNVITENNVVTPETNISKLGLLNRTYHALTRAGIETVGELNKLSAKELLKKKMLGKQGVNDVINTFAKYNLELQSDYIAIKQTPSNNQKIDTKVIRLKVNKDRLKEGPVTFTFDYDGSSEYTIL